MLNDNRLARRALVPLGAFSRHRQVVAELVCRTLSSTGVAGPERAFVDVVASVPHRAQSVRNVLEVHVAATSAVCALGAKARVHTTAGSIMAVVLAGLAADAVPTSNAVAVAVAALADVCARSDRRLSRMVPTHAAILARRRRALRRPRLAVVAGIPVGAGAAPVGARAVIAAVDPSARVVLAVLAEETARAGAGVRVDRHRDTRRAVDAGAAVLAGLRRALVGVHAVCLAAVEGEADGAGSAALPGVPDGALAAESVSAGRGSRDAGGAMQAGSWQIAG